MRSLYDSESGAKKMAVGHHLRECSHTIERSHNLLSRERVERRNISTWMKVGKSGVCDQCGLENLDVGLEGEWGLGAESGVGVWVRRLIPIQSSL